MTSMEISTVSVFIVLTDSNFKYGMKMDLSQECTSSIGGKKIFKKKKCSIASLKAKMKPTKEELNFRENQLVAVDVAETSLKFFKCTKCQRNYKGTINDGRKVSKHPFLEVLMCKKCCDYYGDGNFSLDSDGEDKYCRWCGEGGTILLCSKCIYGFCTVCLKKHLGAQYLTEVQVDDSWVCLFCDPKPLWYLRFICSFAEKVSDARKKTLTQKAGTNKSENDLLPEKKIDQKNAENPVTEVTSTVSETRKDTYNLDESQEIENFISQDLMSSTPLSSKHMKRKVRYLLTTSSSNSSCASSSNKTNNWNNENLNKKLKLGSYTEHQKSKSDSSKLNNEAVEKLENTIRSLEYRLAFGMNFSAKLLKKMLNPNDAFAKENLIKECQNIKQFLSNLTSHLNNYIKSVELVEKSLSEAGSSCQTQDSNVNENSSSYSDVLKFLTCVTNQVKSFKENGVSFSEFLESDAFNYKKVFNNNTMNPLDTQTKEKTVIDVIDATSDKESDAEFQALKKCNQKFLRRQENDKKSAERNSVENLNANLDQMIEDVAVTKNTNELLHILAILENA